MPGIARFSELRGFLEKHREITSCFVDTSILFAATYPFDLFASEAELAFGALDALEVEIFTNVTVKAEFLEAHRRALIAESLIDLLEDMEFESESQLSLKLKSHRTLFRKKMAEERAFKMDTHQIKAFRQLLKNHQRRPAMRGACFVVTT